MYLIGRRFYFEAGIIDNINEKGKKARRKSENKMDT
jgi:hypothetical protein